ncbi:MAG TPA: FHA domain-containing protein [Symbiobacteriaceae bacterium]|jgi:hypothetical protein
MVVNIILILMVIGIVVALIIVRRKPQAGGGQAGPRTQRPAAPPTRAAPAVQKAPQSRPAPIRTAGLNRAQQPVYPQQPAAPQPVYPQQQQPIYPEPQQPVYPQQPAVPYGVGPDPCAQVAASSMAPAPGKVSQLVVEVAGGPDAGRRFLLVQGDNHLGRAQGNHVRLSDPSVSSSHAILRVAGSSATIFDNASTNGAHVNGEKVFEPRTLRSGDQILVGKTVLLFRSEG